jgi:hypothetical protein
MMEFLLLCVTAEIPGKIDESLEKMWIEHRHIAYLPTLTCPWLPEPVTRPTPHACKHANVYCKRLHLSLHRSCVSIVYKGMPAFWSFAKCDHAHQGVEA